MKPRGTHSPILFPPSPFSVLYSLCFFSCHSCLVCLAMFRAEKLWLLRSGLVRSSMLHSCFSVLSCLAVDLRECCRVDLENAHLLSFKYLSTGLCR
jgi:hypothetical protein